MGPEAVTRAREAVAERIAAARVAPGSAFADAVLLVVSELVTKALRHAPLSPMIDMGITVADDQLVVSVADAERGFPTSPSRGCALGFGW